MADIQLNVSGLMSRGSVGNGPSAQTQTIYNHVITACNSEIRLDFRLMCFSMPDINLHNSNQQKRLKM